MDLDVLLLADKWCWQVRAHTHICIIRMCKVFALDLPSMNTLQEAANRGLNIFFLFANRSLRFKD